MVSRNAPSEVESQAVLARLLTMKKQAEQRMDASVEELAQAAWPEVQHADSELVEIGAVTLRQIHQAIERLRQGYYGVCEECGEKIAKARLNALPTSTHCVQCATLQEGSGVSAPAPLVFPDNEPLDENALEDEAKDMMTAGVVEDTPSPRKNRKK